MEVCIGPYSERRLFPVILPINSQVRHLHITERFSIGSSPHVIIVCQRLPGLILHLIPRLLLEFLLLSVGHDVLELLFFI